MAQPPKGYRRATKEEQSRYFGHDPYTSPYEQFQEEYPAIDEYGRKVASGDMFRENIERLGSIDASEQGMNTILDMANFGGMTKRMGEYGANRMMGQHMDDFIGPRMTKEGLAQKRRFDKVDFYDRQRAREKALRTPGVDPGISDRGLLSRDVNVDEEEILNKAFGLLDDAPAPAPRQFGNLSRPPVDWFDRRGLFAGEIKYEVQPRKATGENLNKLDEWWERQKKKKK